MDTKHILELYDQSRKEVRLYGMQREETPHLVRHISGAGEGMILYSNLDAANAEAVIREQIAHFERSGRDFEWVVFQHDTPADLKERLLAHGFEAEDPEAIMVLNLDDLPAALLEPVRHDVRRIHDPDSLADVMAVREGVWQRDFSSAARFLLNRLKDDPDSIGLYVAYVDGKPVSTAQITFYEQGAFAGLVGAGTLPGYRGRGLYTALLAIRAQEAKRREVRFLDADASPMSRPILEKFGFQWVSEAHTCTWGVKGTARG